MTFSVTDALDRHVAALEEERLPDGYWHPSSLFGCARKAVYDFMGTEKAPLDLRTKRVFRMGHIFHALIQEAIETQYHGGRVFSEVKVLDPVRRLKGHADVLVQKEDGSWVMVELKSIRSLKYGDLPKDDHRKQVAAYVSVIRQYGCLWRPEGAGAGDDWIEAYTPDFIVEDGGKKYLQIPPIPDLTDVLFAYVSKEDLSIQEFEQYHTDQKEQWLNQYLETLEAHVTAGSLPKRLIKLTPKGAASKQRHYLCGYCPFAQKCWDEDKEGVDL